MLFEKFVSYLKVLEETSSRNEKTEILSKLLLELKDGDIKEAVYMLSGRISPSFIPLEFNFSNKLVLKALAKLVGESESSVNSSYKKVGDIGEFVEKILKDRKSKNLTLIEVFDQLTNLALLSGKNSQSQKEAAYIQLIKNMSALEGRYCTRIIIGNLRLNLSTKTILDTLSFILKGDKSLREHMDEAYGVSCDIGLITEIVLTKGLEGLKEVNITPGIPVASKLVERAKTPDELINRFDSYYLQPKYDGLRVQIHFNREGFKDDFIHKEILDNLSLFGDKKEECDQCRIFSRNLENLTHMFPEVCESIKNTGINSIILDGEATGFDMSSDIFLPFQETIKRKRKYDVNKMVDAVPLTVNIFDVLELNGVGLLNKPIEERLDKLNEFFKENENNKEFNKVFRKTESTLVKDSKSISVFFNKYIKRNLEGIIVKKYGSLYKPGTRNFDWIKLKASAKKDLVDSVDAVVLGYYIGEGTRSKLGIGAILVGVYDDDKDNFVSLTKVGTGFTEKDLKKMKKVLDEYIIEDMPENYIISKSLKPDVIVSPQIVTTIEADSISKSSMHGKYSLRFPRIKKFGRDKNPNDATTVKELDSMFKLKNN